MTRQTAEALARVGTVAAVRLIALAVAEADDNHADWLRTGCRTRLRADGAPDLEAVCRRLGRDPEEAVRRARRGDPAWTDDAIRA